MTVEDEGMAPSPPDGGVRAADSGEAAGEAAGDAAGEGPGEAAGPGASEAVVGRPYGRVQKVATRRRLFGKAAQSIFFEHLAATCNVAWSARAAGVTAQCAYKKRMTDAAFREGWARALEQGYARLEARLLAEAAGNEPIAIAGDLVLPEAPFDRDLALHLLREHRKGLDGTAALRRGSPREAEWEEVEDYFIRRLKALGVRLDRKEGKAGAAPPAAGDGGDEAPPPGEPGEDRS